MSYKAILCLASIFAMALPATAADIYRWYDADGQLHFGDQPVGIEAETVKGIQRTAGDKQTIERLEKQQDILQRQREHRQETKEKAALAKEERQRQSEKCRKAKDRLFRFTQARFLYERGDDGERRIMDDKGRLDAERKAAAEVDRLCS